MKIPLFLLTAILFNIISVQAYINPRLRNLVRRIPRQDLLDDNVATSSSTATISSVSIPQETGNNTFEDVEKDRERGKYTSGSSTKLPPRVFHPKTPQGGASQDPLAEDNLF